MNGIDATPTDRIRNVILVGHGGVGKTSLAERMLAAANVGDGRGGLLDFEPEERERGHSLGLSVATFAWRDHKINILDAPGTPDAIGDLFGALPAADVALFVVDAAAGVQAQHDELWAACEEAGLPRLVFLNKLDRDNARYQENVAALRERYGKPLAPVHMPLGVGTGFVGVIDLLHFKAVQKVADERKITEVPAEREEQARRNRELLVESIVELDDDLLVRYLDGDVPGADELASCFAGGIARQEFFPVLCGSAAEAIGTRLLADFLVDECPPPAAAADQAAVAYVAKTFSDPYVGRINVLRMVSGSLSQDDTLTVRRSGTSVRLHQLFSLTGKQQTPVSAAIAGDLVAVAKLDDVGTGDVLAANGAEVSMTRAEAPEPFHRVAVEPESSGDEDKLSNVLARIIEEDPSLLVERDGETNQLILRAYGPAHIDVTLERMRRKFGVSVRQVPVRIAYRETLAGPGRATGKHVKQSGGHGQYGIATVEVDPLPRGAGFEFHDEIVGGVVPHTYIPSVEKGVREAMAGGVLAGYPVVDVQVRLVDGKHHSVDSSDMAFQMAGILAFREAAQQAGIILLEPMNEIEVTIPDDLTGDVMGDLSARRGRIQGTNQAVPGRTTVMAQVPAAELATYIAELRSLTRGTGTVRMRYDRHEPVPDHVAKRILEHARTSAD